MTKYKTKCQECKKRLPDYDEMNNRVKYIEKRPVFEIVCEKCAEAYLKRIDHTLYKPDTRSIRNMNNKDEKAEITKLKKIQACA